MTHDELLEAGFVPACAAAEIPTLWPRKVKVHGHSVLLCRGAKEEAVHAVAELCPHKNQSMAFGLVSEGKITCPHHQYAFSLDTGRADRRRCASLDVYDVYVYEGMVYVR